MARVCRVFAKTSETTLRYQVTDSGGTWEATTTTNVVDGYYHDIIIQRDQPDNTRVYVDYGDDTLFGGPPIIYGVTPDGYYLGSDGSKFKLLNGDISDIQLVVGDTVYDPTIDKDDPNFVPVEIIEPGVPYITTQPQDITVDLGTDAVFFVRSTLGTYQWYEVGVGALEGEIGSTLRIVDPGNFDHLRQFYVIATGPEGSVQSDTVTLTIGTEFQDPYLNFVKLQSNLNQVRLTGTGGATYPQTQIPTSPTQRGISFGSFNSGGLNKSEVITPSNDPEGVGYWKKDYIGLERPQTDQWNSIGAWFNISSFDSDFGGSQGAPDIIPIGTDDFCFEVWVRGDPVPEAEGANFIQDRWMPLFDFGGGESFNNHPYTNPEYRKMFLFCHGSYQTGVNANKLGVGYEIKKYQDSYNPNFWNEYTPADETLPYQDVEVVGTTDVRDGNWHAICLDRRDGVAQLFVDGVKEAEFDCPWVLGEAVNHQNPPYSVLGDTNYAVDCDYNFASTYDFWSYDDDERYHSGLPGQGYNLEDAYPGWMGDLRKVRFTVGVSRYRNAYTPTFLDFQSPEARVYGTQTTLASPLGAPTVQNTTEENIFAAEVSVPVPGLGRPALELRVPFRFDLEVRSPLGIPTVDAEAPLDLDIWYIDVPGPLPAPAVQLGNYSSQLRVRTPLGAPRTVVEVEGQIQMAVPVPGLGRPAGKLTQINPVNIDATIRTPLGAPAVAAGASGLEGEALLFDSVVVFDETICNYVSQLTSSILTQSSMRTFRQVQSELTDTMLAVAADALKLKATLLETPNVGDTLTEQQVIQLAEIMYVAGAVETMLQGVVAIISALSATDGRITGGSAEGATAGVAIQDFGPPAVEFTFTGYWQKGTIIQLGLTTDAGPVYVEYTLEHGADAGDTMAAFAAVLDTQPLVAASFNGASVDVTAQAPATTVQL